MDLSTVSDDVLLERTFRYARSERKITQAQTAKIFEKIESLSGEKILKTLAIEFNQPIQTHEVIQPQRDDTVRASLVFTDDEMDIVKHVKDLLSHALPNSTLAQLVVYLAKKQIQAIEGKHIKKTDETTAKTTQRFGTTTERKSIKITTRRKLMEKAGKCCEFVNPESGHRCNGVFQLQVDHKIPIARGGSNHISNLRILCRTHNLLEAKRYGLIWTKPR